MPVYEVGIPVKEVWIFRVSAKNAKEAYEKVRNNGAGEQICSVAGTKKFVKEIKHDEDNN